MRLISTLLLLLPAAVVAAPVKSPRLKASSAATKSAAVAKDLAKFFDEEWEWGLKEFPERATPPGDSRYNDRLTVLSQEAMDRHHQNPKTAMARLKRIARVAHPAHNTLYYVHFQ